MLTDRKLLIVKRDLVSLIVFILRLRAYWEAGIVVIGVCKWGNRCLYAGSPSPQCCLSRPGGPTYGS